MLDVCVWGNSDGQIPLGRHSMVSMVGRFIIGAVVDVMAAVWLAAIWLMFMDPNSCCISLCSYLVALHKWADVDFIEEF
jgi:hypothetical protein